jgi:hypothetical protein
MVQTVILLEVGILAVSLGIVMARRGYVTAYKNFYASSSALLHWGAATIMIGLGFVIAGVFMP